MKKSIIALMALAGMASAATNLIYWGGADEEDLLTIKDGYTPYLAQNSTRADGSVVTTLTTENNADYSLVFDPSQNGNVTTPSFKLNQAIYLNQLDVAGDKNTNKPFPTSFTIDFGTAGSITTSSHLNFGQSVTSITLSASLTTEQLSTLAAAPGNVVTRTLMTGNGDSGIWNFIDAHVTKKITIDNLEGYQCVGQVASAEVLENGQFGFIYTGGGQYSANSVQLVVKAPEPATATLSLLALAGLAARRRRQA
ncbi:MAG: PEP-CTERM sorting domain-containing protein [Akkermansia sp.]